MQSVNLLAYDRGLYHQVDGTELSAVSLDTSTLASGDWSDPVTDWADAVVVWGSKQSTAGKGEAQPTSVGTA